MYHVLCAARQQPSNLFLPQFLSFVTAGQFLTIVISSPSCRLPVFITSKLIGMSSFSDLEIPAEVLALKAEIGENKYREYMHTYAVFNIPQWTYDHLVENRRWFHQHPELSFKEFVTARKIAELLRGYGIPEVFEGIAVTGVVALIRGGRPGKCVALRADIDALPVQETAEV